MENVEYLRITADALDACGVDLGGISAEKLRRAADELERLHADFRAAAVPLSCGHAAHWQAHRNPVDRRSERYCVFCELERLTRELFDAEARCDAWALREQELQAEIERLRAIANARLCSACLENHPIDSMCPPHEVRTTGQAWFRERVAEKSLEIERLRAAIRRWADITDVTGLHRSCECAFCRELRESILREEVQRHEATNHVTWIHADQPPPIGPNGHSGDVLVVTDICGERYIRVGYYGDDGWYFNDTTHWMPLPEFPGGDQD
jgi:hypothetical protein